MPYAKFGNFSGNKRQRIINQHTNKNENPCHVPTDFLKSFELVSIKVKPVALNTLTPNLKMSLHVLDR